MDNPGSLDKQTESPRPVIRPRRRPRTKWNYQRLAIAFAILLFLSSFAAYGGYSLAKRFSGEPEPQQQAKETVAVAAKQVKAPQAATTSTTLPRLFDHTVKEGDSYFVIAQKYKSSVDEIKKINKVAADNNNLQIGMVLKIPAKPGVAIPTTTTTLPKPQAKKAISAASSDKPVMKASSKELFRGAMDKKRVALTFDAAAESAAMPQILEALKDADVKATFFLSGKWMEQNPELTKKIAAHGHVIGNHTYTHSDLTKETGSDIVYQLNKTEEIVKSYTGKSTRPIFRPPFGARDGRVLRVAATAGYTSIYWSIDSLDWKPTMKPSQVKNRVLAALGNGSVILMHCGSGQTAQILPDLIKEIENRGYQMVTVPDMFCDYQPE